MIPADTLPTLDEFLEEAEEKFLLTCLECDGPASLEVRGRTFTEPGHIRLTCPACGEGIEFINL